jgi:ribosomal protein S14
MYYKLVNDNRRRRAVIHTARRRLIRSFFCFTKTTPIYLKKLDTPRLARGSTVTFAKNRCIKTNYRKSVSSFFGLSRIALRQSFLNGQIPYYRISSW